MKSLLVGFFALLMIFGFYNTAISAENLGGKITLTPVVPGILEVNNFDDLFRQARIYLIKSDTSDWWRLEWLYNYDKISFSAFPRHIVVRKFYSFLEDAAAKPWLHGSEIRLDDLEIEAEMLNFKNDSYKWANTIRTHMKVRVSVQLETSGLMERHYELLIDALKNKQPIAIEGEVKLEQDQDPFVYSLESYQNLRLIIIPTQIGNLKLTN